MSGIAMKAAAVALAGLCSAAAFAEDQALGRNDPPVLYTYTYIAPPTGYRDLFLQACGYRYGEIAALTGSTYTGVNRRLAEGRAELRRLERARGRA